MLGNDRNASDTDTAHNSVSSDRDLAAGRRRRQVLFALVAAASVVILFAPESNVPSGLPEGTDKVVHVSLFASLGVTGLLAGIRWRWLVPALLAYAVASEFIQASPLLGRSASAADAVADACGIAAGVLVVVLNRRRSR